MKKYSLLLWLVLLAGLTMLCCGCGEERVNASDCVELGQYLGIEYVPQSTEVTDAVLQTRIEKLLTDNAAVQKITDRKVVDGDTVNIDFTGYLNGKTFSNGSATGYSLIIGSQKFVDGFEDGLIGTEAGQNIDLKLTFPDPYPTNPDLAGQDVVFKVTVNYIEEKEKAVYDDKFVKTLSDGQYTTTEDYDAYLRQQLAAEMVTAAQTAQATAVWDTVINNCTITVYPETMIEKNIQEATEYYQNYADYYKMEMNDEFLKTYFNTDSDTIYAWAYEDIGEQLIVEAIAAAEEIEINNEEYQDGLNHYLTKSGCADDAAFKQKYNMSIEDYYGKDTIEYYLLFQKVLNLVVAQSVAVDKIGNGE